MAGVDKLLLKETCYCMVATAGRLPVKSKVNLSLVGKVHSR